MTFRTEAWDKEIAYQLHHDKAYAHHFVEKLLREGEDPLEVLRRVVRAYGVKELADKTSLKPQSIARVLRAPEKAKEATLNKMVKPFGVKIRRELAFV
jgi:DNA-binding phage protein